MTDSTLILASASPRREQLLAQLGVACVCEPAHIDETPNTGESPEIYVGRMALEKARAVHRRHAAPGQPVLAADTTVVIDDTVLGKPRDRPDALRILTLLSGREHLVMTAVCLIGAVGEFTLRVDTRVRFIALSRDDCEAYLDSGEAWDKAGAYGIQGLAGAFVDAIEGSYSNVVGLPLAETWQMLRANGVATALSARAPAVAADE